MARKTSRKKTRVTAKKPASLPPELLAKRDAFFALIDAPEDSHWKLGDLTNRESQNWSKTGRYKQFKSFYQRVVYNGRKGTAPSYAALTAYARVAATWSEAITVQLGMSKMEVVFSWLTFNQLPFPADPSNIQIPVPEQGGLVTDKTVAEASVGDIRKALQAARNPPAPPTQREAWLIRRADKGLEEFQVGGSALLHLAHGSPSGLAFALGAVPAAHFIELVDCLHEALHANVPGDGEPPPGR